MAYISIFFPESRHDILFKISPNEYKLNELSYLFSTIPLSSHFSCKGKKNVLCLSVLLINLSSGLSKVSIHLHTFYKPLLTMKVIKCNAFSFDWSGAPC